MLNMNIEMLLDGAEAALTGWLGCAAISKKFFLMMGVLNPLDTFVQLLCPTEIRNWTKVVQKVMQRNFVVKMNQLTAKFRIGYYLSQSH